jgi:hypothetical protein
MLSTAKPNSNEWIQHLSAKNTLLQKISYKMVKMHNNLKMNWIRFKKRGKIRKNKLFSLVI